MKFVSSFVAAQNNRSIVNDYNVAVLTEVGLMELIL